MAINKIVYGNSTLMDLTSDNVTPNDVIQGKSFHDRTGASQVGALVTSEIKPTPSANVDEDAIVSAFKDALLEGGTNDDVPSLFGVGKWSNNTKKRYFCPSAGIGVSGIGTWTTGVPTQEEYDTWWFNEGFIFVEEVTPVGTENPKNEGWYVQTTSSGRTFYIPTNDTSVVSGTTYYKDVNTDDIDVKILFDNKYETIALGGYRLDTNRGLMAIRFANKILHPEQARVAVDITYTRTEINS